VRRRRYLLPIFCFAFISTTLACSAPATAASASSERPVWTPIDQVSSLGEYTQYTALACANASDCIAATDSTHYNSFSIFNGRQWSGLSQFASFEGEVLSLACPAADDCLAANANGTVQRFNGSSWSHAIAVGPLSATL